MKLKVKHKTEIHVLDMKDGDMAIITKWGHGHEGAIVQRYSDSLIKLGSHSGGCWPSLFNRTIGLENCYVRILKTGDSIEIE